LELASAHDGSKATSNAGIRTLFPAQSAPEAAAELASAHDGSKATSNAGIRTLFPARSGARGPDLVPGIEIIPDTIQRAGIWRPQSWAGIRARKIQA
jgi:hypothetical protein